MLTFRFRHSRADDLAWWIELAKRGLFKEQTLSDKLTVYETTFDLLDPIQLGHALSLATALLEYRKAEVFAQGQSLRMATVRDVLVCYQHSCAANDAKAYCQVAMRWRIDLLSETPAVLFPCHKAAHLLYGLSQDHHGTIIDKIDSCLVRAGTRWCPRLSNVSDWLPHDAQAHLR